MSHLSEPMIRLLLPKWQMPLLNLWLRWKNSYHNPSLLQDQAQEFHAWMTRHRNFMLEWPRCSDQCNLEMCHELYYYWCWFCDISGSVVVTVTWYLYLCFVHFYFLLSALSVVHFSVSVYSGNPVSLFIDERFDCPLSHLIMFRGFLLKSADTSFLWLLFHHYMNCIRFIL